MEQQENLLKNNHCDDSCPVKKTANIIDGKWTTLVIRELLTGKKRYSQLQRGLHGISPKVLSTRLRALEQQGIIKRSVYATVPPSTEYELTALGKKLEQVIAAMACFGEELSQ